MMWRSVLVSSGSESPSMVASCEHGAEDLNFRSRKKSYSGTAAGQVRFSSIEL